MNACLQCKRAKVGPNFRQSDWLTWLGLWNFSEYVFVLNSRAMLKNMTFYEQHSELSMKSYSERFRNVGACSRTRLQHQQGQGTTTTGDTHSSWSWTSWAPGHQGCSPSGRCTQEVPRDFCPRRSAPPLRGPGRLVWRRRRSWTCWPADWPGGPPSPSLCTCSGRTWGVIRVCGSRGGYGETRSTLAYYVCICWCRASWQTGGLVSEQVIRMVKGGNWRVVLELLLFLLLLLLLLLCFIIINYYYLWSFEFH